MLVRIPQLLDAETCRAMVERLDAAAGWSDGRLTAHGSARRVKANEQLDRDDPAARELAEAVVRALQTDRRFSDTALPSNISRVVFARYAVGMAYGAHLDLPHMGGARGGQVRTDVAFTLFLSDPADYDGGELECFSDYGERIVKGEVGELCLYPASTVHQVRPVTRGERKVAIAWVQSLVADPAAASCFTTC